MLCLELVKNRKQHDEILFLSLFLTFWRFLKVQNMSSRSGQPSFPEDLPFRFHIDKERPFKKTSGIIIQDTLLDNLVEFEGAIIISFVLVFLRPRRAVCGCGSRAGKILPAHPSDFFGGLSPKFENQKNKASNVSLKLTELNKSVK